MLEPLEGTVLIKSSFETPKNNGNYTRIFNIRGLFGHKLSFIFLHVSKIELVSVDEIELCEVISQKVCRVEVF